jgi:excisionase family DNA binding protein
MKNTTNDPRSPPDDTPGDGPAPRLARVLERLDALEAKLNEKFDELRKARDPDALLTEQEAADLLGVTPRTMQTMRKAGEINALRVRSAVRYHRSTLKEYVRQQTKAGTS